MAIRVLIFLLAFVVIANLIISLVGLIFGVNLYKTRRIKMNIYSSIINEFKDMCSMAIEEVTPDNYTDTITMIDEFYT